MEPSKQLPAGFVVAGRYLVERHLGQGGMGSVYCVRHARTDERFALKLLHAGIVADAEAVIRFRREARTPARIDSDHVARVVDADVAPELEGAPYLAMELLRGRDLERESAARGALPPAEVLSHLRQAARALDKAHHLGIVHRDLKPENLFLAQRDDGSVCLKVLDFGIAKLTGGAAAGLTAVRTATGAVFGTPLYMAPEQVRGENARVTPRTDVWALGLIAYKLLTGRDYWVFATLAELVLRITHDPFEPPSARGLGLPAAFDGWFMRCCARPADLRFASAGEAVEALAVAFGLSGVAADACPPAGAREPFASGAFASTLPAMGGSVALASTLPVMGAPPAIPDDLPVAAPRSRQRGPSSLAVVLVLGASLSLLTGAGLVLRRLVSPSALAAIATGAAPTAQGIPVAGIAPAPLATPVRAEPVLSIVAPRAAVPPSPPSAAVKARPPAPLSAPPPSHRPPEGPSASDAKLLEGRE